MEMPFGWAAFVLTVLTERTPTGKNKTRTSFRVFPFVLSTLSTEIITSFVFLALVSTKESRIRNESDKTKMFLFFFLRTKKTKAPGENEFLVFNLKQFRSLSLLQSCDFFLFFQISRSEIATHPPLHVNETHSAHIHTHTRKSAPEKEKNSAIGIITKRTKTPGLFLFFEFFDK